MNKSIDELIQELKCQVCFQDKLSSKTLKTTQKILNKIDVFLTRSYRRNRTQRRIIVLSQLREIKKHKPPIFISQQIDCLVDKYKQKD